MTTPMSEHDIDEKIVSSQTSEVEVLGKPKFYRTPFFSVVVCGCCAFLAPGLFNALSLTGAGGAQSPFLVNKANSILYAFLAVCCIFGSFSTSFMGFKKSLAFGSWGYAIYSGGLYANKMYNNEWVILVGAVCTGITGGVLWATEGAVVLGYPEAKKTGKYLALWLAFRNFGTVIGSAINLAFNNQPTTTGGLSGNTYLVFVILQCFCPFVASLLPEPHQVVRPDGTSPGKMTNRVSVKEEAKAMWERIFKRWDVLLMIPIMLYCTWFSAYSGTFLATYFSSRSRALASFVVGVLSILANVVLGIFLDWKYLSTRKRSIIGYVSIMVLNIVMWVWQTVIQVQYYHNAPKLLDWSAGPGWYAGWGVYIFALIMYNINANFLYWMISEMSRDPQDIVRLAGVLRGVEAAGAAFGFGMNTNKAIFPIVPLAFNFGFCLFVTVCSFPVAWKIGTPFYDKVEAVTEPSKVEA